ncbi:MAG TPA: DUF3710 domain-containing protein [Propionibacteriaceae bacterium]|jgi:hypothetical protein|nr:DUF3710 domain-containing protein [Propionibacteriaceae bacterium]
MIFRRGRNRDDREAQADTTQDEVSNAPQEGNSSTAQGAAASDPRPSEETVEHPASGEATRGSSQAAADLDLAALDSKDWRTEGPFDIDEVDLEADTEDDPPRIDLGSMVLTGFPGAELRLQVAEETQQIVSAMLVTGDSALELGTYAAPRSGGLWAELRDEMIESATEAGGSAALVEGPFGVELRRLLPVSTPDGEQGYQPSRMWVVEGPRWLLRGIVYGQAALEDGIDSPVAELLTAFRHVVVRRGDEPMAPGELLPLHLPTGLTSSDAGS